jgi:hypothetical protein
LAHLRFDVTNYALKLSMVEAIKGQAGWLTLQHVVIDLHKFYDGNPSFFEKRELYLLRNLSRGRGIGFFEAGNFYPDFIVSLLDGEKQRVTFVDPKGIRNLEGPNDPKIRSYKTIKEIETRLGDPKVVLNSFIISNTPFREVRWWADDLSKERLEESHVLFQVEDRAIYVEKMLTALLGAGACA